MLISLEGLVSRLFDSKAMKQSLNDPIEEKHRGLVVINKLNVDIAYPTMHTVWR